MRRRMLLLAMAASCLGCDASKPTVAVPGRDVGRPSGIVEGKAAGVKADNPSDVAALLDRVAGAYRRIGSLELHGTVEHRLTGDGEQDPAAHSIARFHLWFRAPDRYRLEVRTEHPDVPEDDADFLVSWTDPRDAKSYSYHEHKGTRKKQAGNIHAMYDEASAKLGVHGQPLAQMVFGPSTPTGISRPLPKLLAFTKNGVVEPDVPLDGIPSTQVRGDYEGGGTITMWIHPPGAILRGYEIKVTSPDGSEAVTRVRCKGTLDGELLAEAFEFTPPS